MIKCDSFFTSTQQGNIYATSKRVNCARQITRLLIDKFQKSLARLCLLLRYIRLSNNFRDIRYVRK